MRLISRSFARFMRCCSASNEFLPSLVERDDLAVEHGVHLVDQLVDHVDVGVLRVTSRPVRVMSFVSPVVISARQRMPSSLGSNHQSVVVERLPAALGEHRLEPSGRLDQRRGPARWPGTRASPCGSSRSGTPGPG